MDGTLRVSKTGESSKGYLRKYPQKISKAKGQLHIAQPPSTPKRSPTKRPPPGLYVDDGLRVVRSW